MYRPLPQFLASVFIAAGVSLSVSLSPTFTAIPDYLFSAISGGKKGGGSGTEISAGTPAAPEVAVSELPLIGIADESTVIVPNLLIGGDVAAYPNSGVFIIEDPRIARDPNNLLNTSAVQLIASCNSLDPNGDAGPNDPNARCTFSLSSRYGRAGPSQQGVYMIFDDSASKVYNEPAVGLCMDGVDLSDPNGAAPCRPKLETIIPDRPTQTSWERRGQTAWHFDSSDTGREKVHNTPAICVAQTHGDVDPNSWDCIENNPAYTTGSTLPTATRDGQLHFSIDPNSMRPTCDLRVFGFCIWSSVAGIWVPFGSSRCDGTLFTREFLPLDDANDTFVSLIDGSTSYTEADVDDLHYHDNSVHSLFVGSDTDPGIFNSWTFAVRDDGADTVQACQMSSGETSCADNDEGALPTQGSKIALRVDPDSNPNLPTEMYFRVCLQ